MSFWPLLSQTTYTNYDANNKDIISLISIFGAPIFVDSLRLASSLLLHYLALLHYRLQNINDIRNGQRTKVPIFDLETGARNGFKELEVSEDCGVVSYQT